MASDTDAAPPPDDRRVVRVEIIISYVLRIGVIASLSIVAAGCIVGFIRHPEYGSTPATLQRLTQTGAVFPHTVSKLLTGARHLRGQAIVGLGLLLLILTPVMRVAVSILIFIYQRDRVFTLITATVLAILLTSFVLGHAG